MALKDSFNKLIAYFDTDEVADYEEVEQEAAYTEPVAVPETPRRSVSQPQPTPVRESTHLRPVSEVPRPNTSLAQKREQLAQDMPAEEQTKIAIKYPRQYEDAPEIVNLLLENESVLIDFQYMLDAPARRCLDYLSGASSVLYGNLQKVSSSMYLLTPRNVIVNIEDLGLVDTTRSESASFNYDMKRR